MKLRNDYGQSKLTNNLYTPYHSYTNSITEMTDSQIQN
jgi:hypothetical protein